jgi:diketogulonate reductase-like aldo/keto reductase
MVVKKVKLNQQTEIPILGLGTWTLTGPTAVRAAKQALETGYRHLDTAQIYNNQPEVGQALIASGLAREEVFITSKVWHSNLHHDQVIKSAHQILNQLQTDYLDLLLIHWPNKKVPIKETLQAMEELKQEGLIKAIGVSNFTISHLKKSLSTGIKIAVNQVEFHPSFNQQELKDFCDQNEIILTAYSPLGQGRDLDLDVIQDLAAKHDKTEAQIILNWLMSKEIVAIPRSSNPDHIEENFHALGWALEDEDIKRIDQIDKHHRILNPPHAEF